MPSQEIIDALLRGYIDDVAFSTAHARIVWEKRGYVVDGVDDRGRAADTEPERYNPTARRVRVYFRVNQELQVDRLDAKVKIEHLSSTSIEPGRYNSFIFVPRYDCEVYRIVAVEGEVVRVLVNQHVIHQRELGGNDDTRPPLVLLTLDRIPFVFAKDDLAYPLPESGYPVSCLSQFYIVCKNTSTDPKELGIRIIHSTPESV